MTTRVKICGLTTPDDAAAAARAGADAVGFVFAASPRRVSPDDALKMSRQLPPFVVRVGVFVDESYDQVARTVESARLHVVQLHGDEDNRFVERLRRLGCDVMKAVRVRDETVVETAVQTDADALLLDTFSSERAGGTGHTFDWRLAKLTLAALIDQGRDVPIVLAGGLTPENVRGAVGGVRPFGVDVSSGVETAPGHKCPVKMRQFVRKVREADGSAQDDFET